jgi:hypothetical protein
MAPVLVLSLSHQRKRKKKKKSLETALRMSIWGCGSPATYCQPAAVAGFIYCRSQEWALHSPSPTGFVYFEFSWVWQPLLQALTSPSTLGEVAPLLPSPAGLFIYSSNGECFSPTLQSSGGPALFATCLFFFNCLFIIQFVFFLFFPWVGVSLSRGLCQFVPGLSLGVPHAA